MSRGRKPQFNREQVVEQAARLFWEQGYEATGVTELTQHLGIGRQSLYNTFGDKRSLYIDGLRHYFDGRVRLAREIFGRPGPRLERLQELLLAIVEADSACGHPGCLLGNTVAEFGARDEEIEKILGSFLDRFRSVLQALLEEAQQEGELSQGASPADLARSLLVMSQGLLLLNKNRRLRESGLAEAVLRSASGLIGSR